MIKMSDIIKKMTPDYLEDVLVRLAHHSSAIEGNTITLPETATLILNNTLPGNKNITKREFYEVVNHEQAFEYVINMIGNNEKLSISIIKNIHALLTDRLQHDKGKFKEADNYIKGTDFSTVSAEKVPQLMEQLIGNLDYRLKNSESEDDVLRAILEAHIQFEKIHPFSDGNGRAGRMVMNYSLLENNIAPLIIRKDNKIEYMRILGDAQTKQFPDDEDIERFIIFAKPMIQEEKKRMLSFYNKELNQVIDITESKEEQRDRINFLRNNKHKSQER